jgi:hypothetical protein
LNPPFQDLMSISLPGLARFGCDVSATLGGIPNFQLEAAARHEPAGEL